MTLLNQFLDAYSRGTEVSINNVAQNNAIQCCHQHEQFQWIDYEDNCSRWLCNNCRIKLGISIDYLWFCCDHQDMHDDEDENENEENWLLNDIDIVIEK